MYRYFKKIGDTDYISEGKSYGLSDEIIKPSTTSTSNKPSTSNKSQSNKVISSK